MHRLGAVSTYDAVETFLRRTVPYPQCVASRDVHEEGTFAMDYSKTTLRTIAPLTVIALGAGIAFSNFAVVRAERTVPLRGANKVFKCSSGAACVQGESSSYPAGVAGASASGYGVTGTSSGTGSGVLGETTSTGSAVGVFGAATGYGQNVGVYGISYGAAAIYGYQPQSSDPYTTGAVYGDAPNASGIFGNSDNGYGVYAQSNAGTALYAANNGGRYANPTAVLVTNGVTNMLYADNVDTGDYCYITAVATLYCSGSVEAGKALATRHRNSNGLHVTAFAAQSTSETIEDFGGARMYNGVANVTISTDFASVIDRADDYYVFLTPLGDTRGLYVSLKTPSGFQVRENERGRTDVAFDYRIVARPIDASTGRLPSSRLRRPNLRVPEPAHIKPLILQVPH